MKVRAQIEIDIDTGPSDYDELDNVEKEQVVKEMLFDRLRDLHSDVSIKVRIV